MFDVKRLESKILVDLYIDNNLINNRKNDGDLSNLNKFHISLCN